MTLAGLLVFLPAVLSGGLLVHLIWPERRIPALMLKFSLGVGWGLGMNSILYFLQLQIAPLLKWVLLPQLVLLVVLVILVAQRADRTAWPRIALPRFSPVQWSLLAAFLAGSALFVLTFTSRVQARPQGDYDAWSIWDRAARFIYRDPANWRAAISPELYWKSHPDYPLLVPLNVAWGWQAVGMETQRIPIVLAVLFIVASVGLIFTSVLFNRSLGLASLSALILVGTPAFTYTAASLISDVPLMFFILACGILIFFGIEHDNLGLLFLAGFTCGLAGWTKNEGLLFILVVPAALIITQRSGLWRKLAGFTGGLLIPLLVIIFFKSVAPSSDLFSGTPSDILARTIDLWRYGVIFKALWNQILHFGGGVSSTLLILAVYAFLMRRQEAPDPSRAISTVAIILILQFVGYFTVYVLTPHDLAWHVQTSIVRLILQVFPLGIFLVACITIPPEALFSAHAGAEPVKSIPTPLNS